MIVSLVEPKKLSRLFDDFYSCERIFKKLTSGGRIKRVSPGNNAVYIEGFWFNPYLEVEQQVTIVVFYNGEKIEFNNDGNVLSFKLVKFIQELGYDI